jgi:DNA-binding NarL/FixJ family response regulator
VAPDIGASGCVDAAETEIIVVSSDTPFLDRVSSHLAGAPDFRLTCAAATPPMLAAFARGGLWIVDRRTLDGPGGHAWLAASAQCRAKVPVVLACEEIRGCPDCFDFLIGARINGCLSIGAEPALFLRALRAVRAGELWLPRRLLEWAFAAAARGANDGRHQRSLSDLTPQEARVARLAAIGLTNKEIAQQLHIGSETVKRHLKNVFAKMGLRRRAQLASLLNHSGG